MIRVAIVGLGEVTRNVHLPAYSQLKHLVKVVACCDLDRAARDWARDKGCVPRVFDEISDMLEKTRPDVVSVCTPPALHREHTIAALGYGCHVFCEKPLADDLVQTDEIILASKQAQRHVVVNTQYPYMKIHAAAKRLIGSAEFGRLLYLHVWHFRHPFNDVRWRVPLRRRLCTDMGVHIFELMRFFFDDDPVRICAHMPDPVKANRDLINVVSVEFADGRGASMVLNRISQGQERFLVLRLNGESASIETTMESRCRIQAGLYPGGRRPWLALDLFEGGSAVLEKGIRSKRIATEGLNPWVSGTTRHFANFVQDIQSGSEPHCTAKHHRRTLALVFAAYDSAEAGRSIELAPYYLATSQGQRTGNGT
jgi:predicted dehydrogenase